MKKLSIILAMALTAGLIITGCVKKSFDNPPDTSSYDPQLPVNMSIMSLRKMKANTGSASDTLLITQDYTIAAIVNADDRSGNLYKYLYIQDSTGGIQLNIDAYSLYANYPVGRKIYVKLKGLYLSYSGATGVPALSAGINEQGGVIGISGSAVAAHIIKASTGNVVKDTVVTFSQARSYTAAADEALLCRLVTISDSVQFADTVHNYTDPTDATNRYITLCGANLYVGNTAPTSTMAVRTDNYANFHAVKLPYGKGKISGIYTIFRTSPQLIIRDTNDVKFYGPRCGTVTPPSTVPLVTVDSIRKLYVAPGVKLGAYRIHGTVITDAANKNISTGSFIIQSGNKGINIYMGGTISYQVGDSLIVDVSGDSLKPYANMLEIDGVKAANVTKVAANVPVTPRVVTIATLNAAFDSYAATLVKVLNATVTGGGNYNGNSGNQTLSDGTGTIILRTSTAATFAAQPVPTTPKSFTGVAGYFNATKQLSIRNLSDVQ